MSFHFPSQRYLGVCHLRTLFNMLIPPQPRPAGDKLESYINECVAPISASGSPLSRWPNPKTLRIVPIPWKDGSGCCNYVA